MSKATILTKPFSIFLGLVAVAIILFAVVNLNPSLFKGQLVFNESNDSVQVELLNCTNDDCTQPSFVMTAIQDLTNLEFVIQNENTNVMVLADYLDSMTAGDRYEVTLSQDLCYEHTYDTSLSQYTKVSAIDCPAGDYVFLAAGAFASKDSTPFFIQDLAFTLTK